jgi:type II secretory pathway pseudopilin PulG
MGPDAGVTIMEVSIILTVTIIMIGALAPTVSATVSRAKTTRATTDMANIATAMQAFQNDNGQHFTYDGSGTGVRKVSLLVSDGDMPACSAATTDCDGGTTSWNRLVGYTVAGNIVVDFLERHLVTNDPGGNAANDYPVGGGSKWHGAYMNAPIDPDPWGGRYMSNVQQTNLGASNVIVLSAGPNQDTECVFTNPGYTLPDCGGDDIAVLEEN